MSTEKNVTVNSPIVNAIIDNNRYANRRLNAEQIGASSFAEWKTLCRNLQRAAYKVHEHCQNSGMRVENSTVDKSEIYATVRAILNAFGEVKGHKLYANEETAIIMIDYASKTGNKKDPKYAYAEDKLNNRKKELKRLESINGVDPAAIAELKAEIAKLTTDLDALKETPDMKIKEATMASEQSFRFNAEHYFARVITGQMAKSLEQLDKEDEERKARRKATAKANKANKANA